jgi:hypothetical protein
MSRSKGTPMYPKKKVQGSYILTREAALKLQAAHRRTGKSASDVLEFCIRDSADKLTPERANKLTAINEAASA